MIRGEISFLFDRLIGLDRTERRGMCSARSTRTGGMRVDGQRGRSGGRGIVKFFCSAGKSIVFRTPRDDPSDVYERVRVLAPNNRRHSRRASEIIDNNRPARLTTAAAAVVRSVVPTFSNDACIILYVSIRGRAILKIPVHQSALYLRGRTKVQRSWFLTLLGSAASATMPSFHRRLA